MSLGSLIVVVRITERIHLYTAVRCDDTAVHFPSRLTNVWLMASLTYVPGWD